MITNTDLQALGFFIDDTSGSYQLKRTHDSCQVALYDINDPENSISGNLGILHSTSPEQAAADGLEIARAILQDESERAKLPCWQPPSLESCTPETLAIVSPTTSTCAILARFPIRRPSGFTKFRKFPTTSLMRTTFS